MLNNGCSPPLHSLLAQLLMLRFYPPLTWSGVPQLHLHCRMDGFDIRQRRPALSLVFLCRRSVSVATLIPGHLCVYVVRATTLLHSYSTLCIQISFYAPDVRNRHIINTQQAHHLPWSTLYYASSTPMCLRG